MSLSIERLETGNRVDYYFTGSGNIPKQELSCKSDQFIYININGEFDKLEDTCFAHDRLKGIIIRDGYYKHLGNGCFKSPILELCKLPETLESIGHNNFSGNLTHINIPRLINDFPVDNLNECNCLVSISVSAGNESFKAIDGILYNHDASVVVFCPNSRTESIVLPNTVKHIGDGCFSECQRLQKVIIPSSVETIGDSAFSRCKIEDITIPHSVNKIGNSAFWSCEIDNLKIPDTVRTIGRGCFEFAKIAKSLKLPNYLSTIPERAFDSLKAPNLECSFSEVTHIGNRGLAFIRLTMSLDIISLDSLQHTDSGALSYFREPKVIELYSCLKNLGSYTFSNVRSDVNIRYYSMCPIKIDSDVLLELPKNATLVVPPGAKQIFERAAPWALFGNIEECPIDKDVILGREKDASHDAHIKRLKSIMNSTCNYDAEYLKSIVYEVSQDFISIKDDSEYEKACSLLRYNRLFTPAIIPGLDLYLVRNWPLKYRIRYVTESLESGIPVSQLFGGDHVGHLLSENTDSLPINSDPVTAKEDTESNLNRLDSPRQMKKFPLLRLLQLRRHHKA